MTLQDANANMAFNREISIKENLDFILIHLNTPMFPRNIMTKALGHQKEILDADEALTYFKSSDYQDCRINAYPAFTDYQGINFTAPSFIMIDLDLKDSESQEMLDKHYGRHSIIKTKYFMELSPLFFGLAADIIFTNQYVDLFLRRSIDSHVSKTQAKRSNI
jgi:hypothetical protein